MPELYLADALGCHGKPMMRGQEKGHRSGTENPAALAGFAAAARAAVADYEVSYIEKPLSPRDQLLVRLLSNDDESEAAQRRPSIAEQALARVRTELEGLALWNDPGHVYLHCLCEAP